jgi:type I restriction enzyme S subunit
VKKGWDCLPVSSVAEIKYGYTESATDQAIGPRFLRITDIQENTVDWNAVPYCSIDSDGRRKYAINDGDIVFARTGATTGKSFLVKDPPEAVFASYLIRVRVAVADLMPAFVAYYFNTPQYWAAITSGATGSAQGGFNATKLGQLQIPVPPLPEQRRIVAILDRALEGIAAAKANAERVTQNAEAVFEAALEATYDSEDGGQASLESVCSIESTLVDPREKSYANLLHVGGANIKTASDELIDLQTAKDEGLVSGKFAFAEDVVLYSKIRPYLRKVCRPPFSGLCSADIYPLTPSAGKIDRGYLYYLLLSPQFTRYAVEGSARAGMPKVNRPHLFAYRFALPDLNAQRKAGQKLDAIRAATQSASEAVGRKLTALDELKASLLHQAFSGAL